VVSIGAGFASAFVSVAGALAAGGFASPAGAFAAAFFFFFDFLFFFILLVPSAKISFIFGSSILYCEVMVGNG